MEFNFIFVCNPSYVEISLWDTGNISWLKLGKPSLACSEIDMKEII